MVRTHSVLPGATSESTSQQHRMIVRKVGWLWLFSVTLHWLHTKGTLASRAIATSSSPCFSAIASGLGFTGGEPAWRPCKRFRTQVRVPGMTLAHSWSLENRLWHLQLPGMMLCVMCLPLSCKMSRDVWLRMRRPFLSHSVPLRSSSQPYIRQPDHSQSQVACAPDMAARSFRIGSERNNYIYQPATQDHQITCGL